MKKKVILLLMLFSIPFMMSASTRSNYENAKLNTNMYITKYTMYDKYVDIGSNIPYEFDNVNKVKTGFINGGFINKREVELSMINNDSYLFTGSVYFSMTESGNNVYKVDVNKMNLVTKEDYNESRITEFVKPNTKVTGNGTRNDPWVFMGKYRIIFKGNGGKGEMGDIICDFDENCTLPKNNFTKTGYTFDGWSINPTVKANYKDNASVNLSNIILDNEIVLYATWKANTYTVKFDKNSNEASGSTSSVTCTYDVPCTLPKNGFSRVGATYDGWSVTSNSDVKYSDGSNVLNLTATNNGTYILYAHYIINTYNITYSYGNGSAGNYKPSDAKYGEVVTISNPNANSCYRFVGWTITGYDKNYARTGNAINNVNTAINGSVSTMYFKNLVTSGSVKFTANYTYTCSTHTGGSTGGHTGGSHSGGGGSYCDTRCQMQKNSDNWHNTTDPNKRQEYSNNNNDLYKKLPECSNNSCTRDTNGRVTDKNGKCVYNGGKKC